MTLRMDQSLGLEKFGSAQTFVSLPESLLVQSSCIQGILQRMVDPYESSLREDDDDDQ